MKRFRHGSSLENLERRDLFAVDAYPALICDFDGDGQCDVADLDGEKGLLAAGDLVTGVEAENDRRDLTGDDVINTEDLEQWLAAAGTVNGNAGYQLGDANLDGSVDFEDFTTVSTHFASGQLWSEGNFDGSHDGTTFDDFLAFSANVGQTSEIDGPSIQLIGDQVIVRGTDADDVATVKWYRSWFTPYPWPPLPGPFPSPRWCLPSVVTPLPTPTPLPTLGIPNYRTRFIDVSIGTQFERFSVSDVQSILFLGLDGDDTFRNETNLPSVALGGNGNDVVQSGDPLDRLAIDAVFLDLTTRSRVEDWLDDYRPCWLPRVTLGSEADSLAFAAPQADRV